MKTPVGMRCLFCQNKITELDQGVVIPHHPEQGLPRLEPVHLACMMVDVFGRKFVLS